ncbi:LytR/AlgR family response regulator transcription factor [Aquimarina algiphila]|uniref:HTH LytTR-type domain-containing protein n=1 Tax=Aquimarina algiphila TaxID=2047982 RepID=A0A554VPJ0_9FLAO|nr:LytTR family transcriptional regulator DNA-binding domain-containing protein [Aquimarina algiphila]TSE10399.1 hypothetical protein FOF46_05020 [Aquimarina algiphila]
MATKYIYKDEMSRISTPVSDMETMIPPLTGYNEKAWDKKHIHYKDSQKITSLLIDSDINACNILENMLNYHCPYVTITGKLNSVDQAKTWIDTKSLDLVFFGIGTEQKNEFSALKKTGNTNFEVIYITEKEYLNVATLQQNVFGYLRKPIQEIQLLNVVKDVQQKIIQQKDRIKKSKELLENTFRIGSQKDIIGIPTLEGYEFLPIENIICCQGMQKCTKLITNNESNLISSYNIGEFVKLLQPFGFFSTHKSFLINLSKIRKYYKEGSIIMNSGHHIPLARRRKELFLQSIKRDLKFPIIPR